MNLLLKGARSLSYSAVLGFSLLTLACSGEGEQARSQSGSPGQGRGAQSTDSADDIVVVDVAIAQSSGESEALTYTGTTEPVQQVSLRSQTQGQLLALTVDVGDFVQAGQVVGQVDEALLLTDVGEAEAELAARQFEVAQAQTELSDAQARVEQVRVEMEQAEVDAARLRSLADEGVIPEQQAELAETNFLATEQIWRSAQEQVRTRQQAIATVQQRVISQQAMVIQARERLADTSVVAPLTGVVMERLAEPGDFVQSGQGILSIGDFQQIHVMVDIPDRDRSQIRLGQSAQVQLDAFPGRSIAGQVTRISPVADATARLIPVEITIPNNDGQVASGLIARVSLSNAATSRLRIPQSALEVSETGDESVVFVMQGSEEDTVVESRSVQLGDRANGHVEILGGLEPGEFYIVRSSKPLQPGQRVQRSLLSDS